MNSKLKNYTNTQSKNGIIFKYAHSKISSCSNNECEKSNISSSSVFCPVCGYSIKEKEYIKTESFSPLNIYYRTDLEDLNFVDCEKEYIFISNKISPFSTESRRNTEDHIHANLLGVNMNEEIEWFKKEYKKHIENFQNNFGKNSVEFKCGVLIYYA